MQCEHLREHCNLRSSGKWTERYATAERGVCNSGFNPGRMERLVPTRWRHIQCIHTDYRAGCRKPIGGIGDGSAKCNWAVKWARISERNLRNWGETLAEA